LIFLRFPPPFHRRILLAHLLPAFKLTPRPLRAPRLFLPFQSAIFYPPPFSTSPLPVPFSASVFLSVLLVFSSPNRSSYKGKSFFPSLPFKTRSSPLSFFVSGAIFLPRTPTSPQPDLLFVNPCTNLSFAGVPW